ncbi:hypothetical protein [Candidatus Palauibacter sp.]|uniref:hypothetical protein n=1 Tax=Candidatus Palauibacter sp. TaxID=3101350 RepID=UPI003AF2D9AF
MDRAERQRSAYRRILEALDEAIFWLGGVPTGDPDDHEAERQGTFRLGEAGGIAFSAHFPGTNSGALFDEISDAAEAWDLDRVRQVRSLVESRLRSAEDADGRASAEGALDWDAGYLQTLAVLNETRHAREDGDAHRYWIMTGFLAGFLHWDTRRGRYEPGSLRDEVIAACNEGWGADLWMEWEAIREEWLAGDASGSRQDPDLLLRWLGLRLAVADRATGPLFSSRVSSRVGETDDERSEREPDERAYFMRSERSTRRAQNFGKRIAKRDDTAAYEPGRGLPDGSR